jgi:hypothetical protein
MSLALSFNYHEAKVLLNWFENSRIKGERFGSSRYEFPQEEILVEKLKNPMLHSFYEPMDVEIMIGWMEKTLGPTIGNEKFYFPLEEEIFKRLKNAQDQGKSKIKNESSITKQSAIEYADKLINEKIQGEHQQKNQRQQDLQQRLKENKQKKQKTNWTSRIKTFLEIFFHFGNKKANE